MEGGALSLGEGGCDHQVAFRLGHFIGDHDGAGEDGVDADPGISGSEFDGQAAGEGGNGAFGGEIGSVIEVGTGLGPVAEVDDAAAGGLVDHRQAGVLTGEEGAEGVDLKVAADVGGGDLFEGFGRPDGRGIHQDVDAPEAGEDLVDQVFDGFLVGQLGLEGISLQAACLEILNGNGGFLGGRSVVDSQRVAAVGEGLGDVPANALFACAGDQGNGCMLVGHDGLTSSVRDVIK